MNKVKKIEPIMKLDTTLIELVEPETKYRILDLAVISRLNEIIKTLNLLSEAKK